MLSVLVRLFGLNQVEVAEDIVQETLIAALENWKLKGMPDNPRAWLYRVAKNRTLDLLRRERNFRDNIAPNISIALQQEADGRRWLDDFFLENEIEDAQLRMMFACCHDAVPPASQLVLILRTLCGLSAGEIAAALLVPEETIAKRLYRAKEKIRAENLVLEVPSGDDLVRRLDAVLQAVYLLFNEGYKSVSDNQVIRRDLCAEALRLGDLLTRHPVSDLPKTHALQSLMCFNASRFDARMDEKGGIILLENQDRSKWNHTFIGIGYQHLTRSSSGNKISEYHIEAAIASYHASAPTFGQTNWQAIFYCYNLLMQFNPSPFVAFNRAIALGYAEGPQKGIDALTQIEGLEKSHLYHTALGDFYQKTGNDSAAQTAYKKALSLVTLAAEREIILKKMGA